VSRPGIPRLHHTGFVVENIKVSMPGFLRSLDGQWDEVITADPHQKVAVAFLSTRAGDALIELVQPNGDGSPVSRFLTERGGGLHHLCYEVDDLDAQLATMKARGALIAKRPKPAAAFGGRRIAWVLTTENLLVEYLAATQEEGR
jgi:methylmalonyl-CoA/ethylmalonyl-CoA epimerase